MSREKRTHPPKETQIWKVMMKQAITEEEVLTARRLRKEWLYEPIAWGGVVPHSPRLTTQLVVNSFDYVTTSSNLGRWEYALLFWR